VSSGNKEPASRTRPPTFDRRPDLRQHVGSRRHSEANSHCEQAQAAGPRLAMPLDDLTLERIFGHAAHPQAEQVEASTDASLCTCCRVCMLEAVGKLTSTAIKSVNLGLGILATLTRGLNRTSEKLAVVTLVQLGLATVGSRREPGTCVGERRCLSDAGSERVTDEFSSRLVDLIPRLRRLAVALTGDLDQADDLVQETCARRLIAD
jgi:hypothetical protein